MKFQDNHTYLFVPGTRLDRIPKAFAAGAAAVILDLEDSVADAKKGEVRQNILDHADQLNHPNIWLRVNATDTPYFYDDLYAAKNLPSLAGIVLPKTEHPDQLREIYSATFKKVLAIIESGRAILNLAKIAASPHLEALTYGNLDLICDTGTAPLTPQANQLYDYVRLQLLLHSAANNLPAPIDSVYQNFQDDDGLRTYVRHWKNLGFGGMLCIHPRQVAVVQQEIAPTPEEIDFAQRVLNTYKESGSAAFQLDGKMIDIPVIKQSEKILEKAKRLAADKPS